MKLHHTGKEHFPQEPWTIKQNPSAVETAFQAVGQNTAIACAGLLKLESKTLLLKMPHTADTELGGAELEPTWKLPPED